MAMAKKAVKAKSKKQARKSKGPKARKKSVITKAYVANQTTLAGLSGADQKLILALQNLGDFPEAREVIVSALREIEKTVMLPINRSVREELTGPICDALFKFSGVQHKKLADGTDFSFVYRSKIARDFILSPDPKPDHVFEPQTTKLFVKLCKGVKHVLIGGAYAGDHAIVGAKVAAKSGGIIHCFEPSDEQRNLLLHNADDNSVNGQIKSSELGLWSKGNTILELAGNDAFAYARELRGNKKGKITFKATSIDAYGKKNKIKNFDLILMDIEGSELPALQGAAHYLSQPKGQAPNIIFEVHRFYVDWSKGLENSDIVKYLRKFGYHVYAMRDFQSNVPMRGCKIELMEPKDVYLHGPPHGFNMLAVKDDSIVRGDKDFRIVKGVSPKLLLHKDPKLHWPAEWQ
ncbi:MAG: FkbM family methyltransferase [Alphaproteobacteria bacterium]|nr:MAG: FkbM family methyltransferase [Alphaproteobacteria bacterium]